MPAHPPRIVHLTRRQLLARTSGAFGAIAAVGALASCGGDGGGAATTGVSQAGKSNSVYVDVATAERVLIARYTETIVAFPGLSAMLEPLKRQHEQHLAVVGVQVPDPLPQVPPTDQDQAVAALRQAEVTASIERQKSCVLATEPEFARTLTFIAASEASHVAALKSAGRSR